MQRAAISVWPPSSGLMYQVSTGGPAGPELHADTRAAMTATTTVMRPPQPSSWVAHSVIPSPARAMEALPGGDW